MIGMEIAITHPHVDNRREPPAIFSRESPFIKGDVLQCVGIKGRENTHHMAHVIKRISIKKIKILVGIATSDGECCQSIVAHRHTRQILQGTHHIRLAQ